MLREGWGTTRRPTIVHFDLPAGDVECARTLAFSG
jgi:hypothetical protein